MSQRRIRTEKAIQPCPKCGNRHDFVAVSQQVMEDGCEMWLRCGSCGHEPDDMERREDVWGVLDTDSIVALIMDWDEWAERQAAAPANA